MQTNAHYRFNGEGDFQVGFGPDESMADIEFRGLGARVACDSKRILRPPDHYIRVCGLTADQCDELAKQLKLAAREIRRAEKRVQSPTKRVSTRR